MYVEFFTRKRLPYASVKRSEVTMSMQLRELHLLNKCNGDMKYGEILRNVQNIKKLTLDS